MLVYLQQWFKGNVQKFIEDMRADLDLVLMIYHFKNAGVSISESYHYDPPLYYISCTIGIEDEKGDSCVIYCLFRLRAELL